MPVHDGSLRSPQGLQSSLYNPLISRGFSPPHLLLFQVQKAREGKLSPGPRPPKQDERLHEGHQSDYHTPHRLTGGGVLMVALWLQSTKTDVVKLLSFLMHKMAGMPVVRAHVCACVCSNHLKEQN